MASGPFTSKAAEADAIMKQDEKKGVPVHSFDPNASPEEKGAQAGKARDQLESVIPQSEASQGRGKRQSVISLSPTVRSIASAVHWSRLSCVNVVLCPAIRFRTRFYQSPSLSRITYSYANIHAPLIFPFTTEIKMADQKIPPALPTIIIEDLGDGEKVVAKDTEQVAEQIQQDEAAAIPGALPNKRAPAIPDWYKVGWRQMSGIDKPPLPEGEERDKGVLDAFLAEQYYGSWYHNAGVIVFVRFYLSS